MSDDERGETRFMFFGVAIGMALILLVVMSNCQTSEFLRNDIQRMEKACSE